MLGRRDGQEPNIAGHKTGPRARNDAMSTSGDLDDTLLLRYLQGDPEAFVALYRRHLPTMLAFFLRRTGDRELSADLTAEVFAAALIAAERYRPGERPALAWLYGIAAHKLADSRRRGQVRDAARRKLQLHALVADDEDLARVETLADGRDHDLEQALARLPAVQRDAVLARVVQERPYAEIAAAMRCSQMLVRQRVSRGLKTLRTDLEERR